MKYSDSEIRIPEDIASEVLTLASRYYAEQNQGYTLSELTQASAEVQIPPELIELAVLKVQAQRQQKLEQQERIKQKRQIFLKVGGCFLIAIAFGTIYIYNSLNLAISEPLAAWAQVENQLQRRADLIPKLVQITQSYAQEKEIIDFLNKSRQGYLQAKTPEEKLQALTLVNRAITNFQNYAITDSHLQKSQLFINLQYEIAGTENRIATERMRYNQATSAYNQKIQQFPNLLFAKNFGFKPMSIYQLKR
ncbi:LemA family protein [Pleurocapsa sp. FMAR1]|uniref:LemA family protein n=1 Tax=Pleurocapsa sp. FMAR1 TaxID=3040204 RepID=UPI0029C7A8A1|nr:LemA family protein [Pleurocapsa sp. FMAR1]